MKSIAYHEKNQGNQAKENKMKKQSDFNCGLFPIVHDAPILDEAYYPIKKEAEASKPQYVYRPIERSSFLNALWEIFEPALAIGFLVLFGVCAYILMGI